MDLVVTIRDVERPKPHPEMLWKVLGHFSLAAADAVYIGDSGLDRRAAADAGVPFLGFRDGSIGAAQTPGDVESRIGAVLAE
jgi:phosphoglycolate phosphatase-like HAD superfamily hydrolase